jgi:hypothetical protein
MLIAMPLAIPSRPVVGHRNEPQWTSTRIETFARTTMMTIESLAAIAAATKERAVVDNGAMIGTPGNIARGKPRTLFWGGLRRLGWQVDMRKIHSIMIIPHGGRDIGRLEERIEAWNEKVGSSLRTAVPMVRSKQNLRARRVWEVRPTARVDEDRELNVIVAVIPRTPVQTMVFQSRSPKPQQLEDDVIQAVPIVVGAPLMRAISPGAARRIALR